MADESVQDAMHRLMFGIAYRMLGSVADAEDVAQDAYVRIEAARRRGVDVTFDRAYAATVATRTSIDLLRSARRRRETYVGDWLPEPLVEDADPALQVEQNETLTVAFLVLLERLRPVDRAVFVLRHAFRFGYDEIAAIVGKSEAACRQIFSRARRTLRGAGEAPPPATGESGRLAGRLAAAMHAGDAVAVAGLLSADVVFSADGGGKAPAISAPIHGAEPVARFLVWLGRQAQRTGVRMEPARANAADAFRLIGPDGRLLGVLTIGVRRGSISQVFNQINPDKLKHLGPVGDAYAVAGVSRRGGGSDVR